MYRYIYGCICAFDHHIQWEILLHIQNSDHGILKARFQKIFESEWDQKKQELFQKYGIVSYEVIANNGTKETRNVTDFSISGRGGLKILFKVATIPKGTPFGRRRTESKLQKVQIYIILKIINLQ